MRWNGPVVPSTSGFSAAAMYPMASPAARQTHPHGATRPHLSKADLPATSTSISTTTTSSLTLHSVVSSQGPTPRVHFEIIFLTSLPKGDWAGNVWAQDPTCSPKAATCQDYVQNNPSAFSSAYWTINSLKVYTAGGSTSPVAVAATAPSSSPAAVAASETSSTPIASSTPPAPSTSAPAQSSGAVAIGSTTPGGALSENPIPPQNQGAPAGDAVSIGSDTPGGTLTENPVARSLAEVVGSSPAAKEKRSMPRMMRHLRRHQKLTGHI